MRIPLQLLEEHLDDAELEWAFERRDRSLISNLRSHAATGEGGLWLADVTDGAGRNAVKQVEVRLEGGHVIGATCSCRSKAQPFCRHVALVAWDLDLIGSGKKPKPTEEGNAPSQRQKHRAAPRKTRWSLNVVLEELDAGELLELVQIWSEAEPRFASGLYLRYGYSDPKESVQAYRKHIKGAINPILGRTKKVAKAIGKEALRVFNGQLEPVRVHLAAGRGRPANFILQAILMELLSVEPRLRELMQFEETLARILELIPAAAATERASKYSIPVVEGWREAAKDPESRKDAPMRLVCLAAGLASTSGSSERSLMLSSVSLRGSMAHLVNGFAHYLEGKQHLADQHWGQLGDQLLGLEWLFPHFIHREDWTIAEQWARKMIERALEDGDAQALGRCARLLMKVASAAGDEALLHDACGWNCLFHGADQIAHLNQFLAHATPPELTELANRFLFTRDAIPAEAVQTLVRGLHGAGLEGDLVHLLFHTLKIGSCNIEDLFPVVDLVRKPMDNMWIEFLKQSAVHQADRLYFGSNNEGRFIAIMTQLKQDGTAADYREVEERIRKAHRTNYAVERAFLRLR